MPKVFRRSHLQLNRRGCGRRFCLNKTNNAAHVHAFERGASNPKYRIACRPRSDTCSFKMATNLSFEYRTFAN